MITAIDIQNRFGGGPYVLMVNGDVPVTDPALTGAQQAELLKAWAAGGFVDVPAGRKVWATKAEFWGEFTEAEQLAIMDSTVAGIKLLDRQLLVWNGEVWSDDARVQAGLSGLVAVGILTAERKAAILA
jgi:hypothetical protein